MQTTVRRSVLTERRTMSMMATVDVEALVVEALAQVGITADRAPSRPDRRVDLVLDPEGVNLGVQVKRRALVTEDDAHRLLADHASADVLLLVVGDRVTEQARTLLLTGRAGYYDLRGHLAARSKHLVIDTAVEPVRQRGQRTEALGGRVGLEVAAALLMQPDRAAAVRSLARELSRSASTVSEVLTGLRRGGLIDAANTVTDTALFWALADRWPTRRIPLARAPLRDDKELAGPLRWGLTDVDHESGWALTGSVAAVAYGAPLATRAGEVLDFYVPDQAIARRATTLLGHTESIAHAAATVSIAPVPAAVNRRITNPHPDTDSGWPLAHPLFVALDLAQDHGRGRQILTDWTPGQATRVW